MCILAHPDDETLSTGGILAKYAAEGVETYLLCATRGERGWAGKPEEKPGLKELGRLREGELRCAGKVLGLREISFLDYIDGEVPRANPAEIISRIAAHLRRMRPQVVVIMDPQGVYGHPDHIATNQFAQAAIVAAAGPGGTDNLTPHCVSKLYMVAESDATYAAFSSAFGSEMHMVVDGVDRRPRGWNNWECSAVIDAAAFWPRVVEALACHRSQIRSMEPFVNMPQHFPPEAWGIRSYYRVFSLVNGGKEKEADLFAGLRDA